MAKLSFPYEKILVSDFSVSNMQPIAIGMHFVSDKSDRNWVKFPMNSGQTTDIISTISANSFLKS